VSVIIPARDEKENIVKCLSSIINQNYEDFEIIVIDDGSTDGTLEKVREIQRTCNKIKLFRNTRLPSGWVGKSYVLHLGVKEAIGDWFLFLDADTELYPEAIRKTLGFCLSNGISMVSFSPEQVLVGFWEKAIQPVIFELLDSIYDYDRINNPHTEDAAANGQFIFIERKAYEKAGGHEAVRDRILEDVVLAKNVKQSGFRLYFAHGRGVVRCRMYKSLGEIIEGWTKNLFMLIGYEWSALLRVVFGLAYFSLLPFLLLFCSFILLIMETSFLHVLLFISFMCLLILSCYPKWTKFKRLNYPKATVFLYPIGTGFSIVLFLLSAYKTLRSKVRWKGREYRVLSKRSRHAEE
jgi:chlorobactene glucosyltransferase